ncbi:DNA-processing protein DprA [Nocardiopsis kunsanensis]|uniref:DNA processing protein DprA n=1 Tax=Nocardiopsis kunsanensis TaxID=141693 RepID=A0A918XBR3_9ACTN|nr:DNA-processing protein DprA [Nocardiopsis kunsanensis]GHD22562.1 DNA processing protein DprA [Nocardiopsis kunsanensis]
MNERDDQVRARACLTAVAEPGNTWLAELLDRHGAARVWTALAGGQAPPGTGPVNADAGPETHRAMERTWKQWRARAERVDPDGLLGASAERGVRFVAPGDPEWPGRLDGLDPGPYGLWVRGGGDLRNLCLRSVALVGARAATSYGEHVASEMACTLGEHSVVTVSGGAYGIDGAAHRAAHAVGATVVVLACGLDVDYPRGHAALFADVARRGVLVSERPLGATPRARDFLVRNRLIAALTPGTVVVEAGRRSGALNTATHATSMGRSVMAVPGPVTSALSVGCHALLRDHGALCVTGAADVLEYLAGEAGPEPSGPVRVEADLSPETERVLAAVPRTGAGTASIALECGGDLEGTMRALGVLAAAGLVERCAAGWRPTRT